MKKITYRSAQAELAEHGIALLQLLDGVGCITGYQLTTTEADSIECDDLRQAYVVGMCAAGRPVLAPFICTSGTLEEAEVAS